MKLTETLDRHWISLTSHGNRCNVSNETKFTVYLTWNDDQIMNNVRILISANGFQLRSRTAQDEGSSIASIIEEFVGRAPHKRGHVPFAG